MPFSVLPRPLFALLIGIDKYEHYPPLFGAVKDMECISDFLTNSLAVPNNRITKLLDNEATKDAIVKMIRSLANSSDIIRNDAILIYFAGHGARATAPHGWPTNDGYIETICPVDISALPTAEPLVTGIPDLVLNMLITQLAEEKGDNIVWFRFSTFRVPLSNTSFLGSNRLSSSIVVTRRVVCVASRLQRAFVQ